MAGGRPEQSFEEWPRMESNHRAQIRSLPLYPLSYGATRPQCASCYFGNRVTQTSVVGAGVAPKGWRTGLEPATTGTTTRGSTN